MSNETYAIVFKGDIVDGFEAAAVQAQLAKLLKIDAKKAAGLFSGKQIVLKKTADKAAAAKYGKALKKVGADVKIRIIKADAQAQPAPAKPAAPVFQKADDDDAAPVFQKADDAPAFQKADDAAPAFQKADDEAAPARRARRAKKPAAAPAAEADTAPPAPSEPATVDTSGITLAPNEGDLFEPAPEAETPDLDLSEYSVSEFDDTPLAEPAEEVIVELDLSDFSVAENDGSPLVEASDEIVPEVEVPDFGLDEPGAVLETIQEEKEILNPNTMGMTIAAAGADLLEEDEKPPAPPPVAPDTSGINLVPNFDT